MITVYGIRSPYVARVRASLLHKQLPFEHVNVNMRKKSDKFKKLTPIETIPVVVDTDGTVLCDSFQALDYLDAKYPQTYKMLGENLPERVKILTIIEAADKMMSFFGPLYIEKFQLAESQRESGRSHRALIYDEQQKKDLQKEITYRLGRIKDLRDGMFFTRKFSAADAAILSLFSNMDTLGLEIGEWKAWRERLLENQTIAKMFASPEEKGVRDI